MSSITRTSRKEINPALHRAGLPTLGAARTMAEYRKSLTKAQRVVLDALTGAPAPTGHVRAKIRAAREAREAASAALSALAVECECPAWALPHVADKGHTIWCAA